VAAEKNIKCCLEKDMNQEKQLSAEEIFSLFESIFARASMFIQTSRFKDDIERAGKEFYNIPPGEELDRSSLTPLDQNNFMFWFMCDYKLQNENVAPLEHFFDNKGEELAEEEKELTQSLIKSNLSLYDVMNVNEEEAKAQVRDLFLRKAYEITDLRVLRVAQQGVLLGLRLIAWNGAVLNAGDLYVFPVETLEGILRYFKKQSYNHRAIVQPTMKELLKNKGQMFNHIQLSLRRSSPYIKSQQEDPMDDTPPPKAEESAIATISRAHFILEDKEKMIKIMDTLNQLEKKESGDIVKYNWFKKPVHPVGAREDGCAIVSRRKVLLETDNPELLEDMKSYLNKNSKELVKHMYDDFEKRRSFAVETI
jgi:hypothetical protein